MGTRLIVYLIIGLTVLISVWAATCELKELSKNFKINKSTLK